ncbi:MAG TPA: hypothetical protein VNT60_10795 [Deinococcales bacterium]|nr:hypothetical protein [Deinococcales bacterium]
MSAFLGGLLALSGLAVLALLRFVRDPRQKLILVPVALLDIVGGLVVLGLGLAGVLP